MNHDASTEVGDHVPRGMKTRGPSSELPVNSRKCGSRVLPASTVEVRTSEFWCGHVREAELRTAFRAPPFPRGRHASQCAARAVPVPQTLDGKQVARVASWQEAKADPDAGALSRWTTADIRDRIMDGFGVHCTIKGVRRLMRRIGFRHVFPRPDRPKANFVDCGRNPQRFREAGGGGRSRQRVRGEFLGASPGKR